MPTWDDELVLKPTPAGADEFPILDSDITEGNAGREAKITLTSVQTPWLQTVNANNHSLQYLQSLLDLSGNIILVPAFVGSAENHLIISNAVNGAGPSISTDGISDSNIDINFLPSGTGRIDVNGAPIKNTPSILDSLANTILTLNTVSLPENYLTITSATDGEGPILGVAGVDDTDIDLNLQPLGTGAITIEQSASGVTSKISSGGSDTNIDLVIDAKGTGSVDFSSNRVFDIKELDVELPTAETVSGDITVDLSGTTYGRSRLYFELSESADFEIVGGNNGNRVIMFVRNPDNDSYEVLLSGIGVTSFTDIISSPGITLTLDQWLRITIDVIDADTRYIVGVEGPTVYT